MPTIIFLNGVGSAGKRPSENPSVDYRAPLLRIEMDTFLEMMPDKYHDHP